MRHPGMRVYDPTLSILATCVATGWLRMAIKQMDPFQCAPYWALQDVGLLLGRCGL